MQNNNNNDTNSNDTNSNMYDGLMKNLSEIMDTANKEEMKLLKRVHNIVNNNSGSYKQIDMLFNLFFEREELGSQQETTNNVALFSSLIDKDHIPCVTKTNILDTVAKGVQHMSEIFNLITFRSRNIRELMTSYNPDETSPDNVIIRIKQVLISQPAKKDGFTEKELLETTIEAIKQNI